MAEPKYNVMLVPLDPVHDIGLKMIKRALEKAGHKVTLLPPDYTIEEIIHEIIKSKAETVLISRTLGYGVEELLAKFVDLADAAGLRDKTKIGVGGMAITPELAAELGFDSGFGPGSKIEEAVAFVEGREYRPSNNMSEKNKKDMTAGFDYMFNHTIIKQFLDDICDQILEWSKNKTTPGIKRAFLREMMLETNDDKLLEELKEEYKHCCDDVVQRFYNEGKIHEKTRQLTQNEFNALSKYLKNIKNKLQLKKLQHVKDNPLIFIQYGTGCPFMDIAHIKISEEWGADGVVHFDPSWGARTEGLFEGCLTHLEDGSVITPENLMTIRKAINKNILWQVRAHRGLNTPETALLAGKTGADLTKINIVYGSLSGGTDPSRLTMDGIFAIRYAAKYKLPFDVVTNEELSGVPAFKAFAGMLIVANLGLKLGGSPILQPLFCNSPEVMINELMENNYVDFNAAKIMALRKIVNAPIWPGAPIGFLTHTEDRVQSSVTTSLHAALASSLKVQAISIASSDEAFSYGPIAAASRIDTLRATAEAFRFFGSSEITPTRNAEIWSEEIVEKIELTLKKIAEREDFAASLYEGLLGTAQEGAYPGRAGRESVMMLA
jgi:methylmalonyl-CoA mutase cobalamin-binding domain/chain